MKEEILRLHADRLSYRAIQRQLGCSKGTIAYHLGPGQKAQTLQRTRDKRNLVTRHIQDVKSSTPCTDCGENFPYWVMEFDHLGDKSFTISNYRSTTLSLDRVIEEIAKCEIVCANCHRGRTHRRSIRTGHGLGPTEPVE